MRHSPLSIVRCCPRVENVERRVLFSTMTPMPALASGDFNGDGSSDTLVFVNVSRGRLADLGLDLPASAFRRGSFLLLASDGALIAPLSSLRARGNVAPVVAVADFNSDGHLDVVIGGRLIGGARQGLTFLVGNGDGTFAAGTPVVGAPSDVTSLAAGDFNGDGRADLIGTARSTSASASSTGTNGINGVANFTLKRRRGQRAFRNFVELPTDNGANRPHLVGSTAETGGGFSPTPFQTAGSDVSTPPGILPPAARTGATEEAGGARVGGFENHFFLGGTTIADDQTFVLLGNGDGTFTASTGTTTP